MNHPSRESGLNPSILLVTAGDDQTALLEDCLWKAGYLTVRTETIDQGIEFAGSEPPAAAFVELSSGDAVELDALAGFCRALQPMNTAILLIGEERTGEALTRAYQAGCCEYLVKPLQAGEVLARMRHWIAVQGGAGKQRAIIERLSRNQAASRRLATETIHDLRNPLLSIRGLGQLLTVHPQCSDNPVVKEAGEAIVAAGKRGLDLVAEGLENSWGKDKPSPPVIKVHDVGEMLSEAVSAVEGWASGKGIQLKLIQPSEPLLFPFDRRQLMKAAENLIGNAVKYSPAGGQIDVETQWTVNGMMIAVRDQGPGFAEEERKLLFEEFRRASANPTDGEGCAGLGLAICQQIVAAHHGTLDCRNLSPRGSEFSIHLPILADEPETDFAKVDQPHTKQPAKRHSQETATF